MILRNDIITTNFNRLIFVFFIFGIFFIINKKSIGQEIENEFQQRLGAELTYSPIKKLQLGFEPEFRSSNGFSKNRYIFNLNSEYKVIKYLKLEARYRYGIITKTESANEDYHRYAFGVIGKTKIDRFKPSFRLRYTNDADDQTANKQFLRYKAALKYNIVDCKITPQFAVEAFQMFGDDAGLYKMRYTIGASHRLSKNQYLKVAYKFDYYHKEYKNRHILSVGYRLNF